MSDGVDEDQFAIIQVMGLHSHSCERSIQRSLLRFDGIREVEVDFASGLASVLFDARKVSLDTLKRAVADAGYEVGTITAGRAGVT